MTTLERIIVTGYTGVMMTTFGVFQLAVEARLGEPMMTHEFGDRHVWETRIKPAFRDDFLLLCDDEAV